jgi:putative effector of murein hydrolase LrgA (UPF0299 family)
MRFFCRGQFILSSMPATEAEALLRDTQCLWVPSMVACMPLAGCLSQQLIHIDTYDYLTHVQVNSVPLTSLQKNANKTELSLSKALSFAQPCRAS